MRCIICGILIDTIDEAIEAGWIPYFHEGDQQHESACRESFSPPDPQRRPGGPT